MIRKVKEDLIFHEKEKMKIIQRMVNNRITKKKITKKARFYKK